MDEVYTLTLIFDESYTDDDGKDISVPVFLPYSYSSEELALDNAEMAEHVFEDLVSWGITKVEIDREISAQSSENIVH